MKHAENGKEIGVFKTTDTKVKNDVLAIAKELKSLNKCVDTKTYKIKCNVCYSYFKGNEEVVAHSKLTGHGNFMQLE